MWTDGPILPEPFTNLLTSDFDEDKSNDKDYIENVSDVYPDSLGVEDNDDWIVLLNDLWKRWVL